MLTKLEVLKKARELVQAGWTQEQDACGSAGEKVAFSSPEAKCFCATGAISRAAYELGGWSKTDETRIAAFTRSDDRHIAGLAYGELTTELNGEEPYEWNDEDGRTREQVLALFDQVIQRLEAA